MTALWDNEEYINDNALTVNISRLRAKLSDFIQDNTPVSFLFLSHLRIRNPKASLLTCLY